MDSLRMHDVDFAYPGGPKVLHGISLRVSKGQLVVVAGRSGSGKSSLLQVAAGLQRPRKGRVEVAGQSMAKDPATVRADHVGLVFQHLNLLDELTVAENIALPLHLRGIGGRERNRRVESLIQRFGLAHLKGRLPGKLSGGEQQRTAIARALATSPSLLLVDEPTSALDKENALTVIQALEEAAHAGAGVLVVSHDDLLTARPGAIRIEGGRIGQ